MSLAVTLLLACALPTFGSVHIEPLVESGPVKPFISGTNGFSIAPSTTLTAPNISFLKAALTSSQATSAISPVLQIVVVNTNALSTGASPTGLTFTVAGSVGGTRFATPLTNVFTFALTNVPNSTNVYQVPVPAAQFQSKDDLMVTSIVNSDTTNTTWVQAELGESE